MSTAPLAGIRVLDLTSVVVGPACTQRLADYGADIVKVEAAAGGDLYRTLGGPSPTGRHGGGYLHLNRNKRDVCLDLKLPGGQDALTRLLARSDVFVSNMRPEALARLRLDAASLRGRQPGWCIARSPATAPAARIAASPPMTASSRVPRASPP